MSFKNYKGEGGIQRGGIGRFPAPFPSLDALHRIFCMAPRARGRLLFCIGRLWQGVEAMFRGLIPIPYLLRRWRRSGVCGGFVFCFGLVRGGFVLPKLTTFLEFCGNIANLASPVCRVLGRAPSLLCGESDRCPSIPRFGGQYGYPPLSFGRP